MITKHDQHWMKQAIELAQKGEGHVEPNPMVGCVIATEDQLISSGFHQAFGDAHAEVNAIANAGVIPDNASLYVTLEPCCHTGKTPPCTQAVIESGIKRVVIGSTDPNPTVNGDGIKKLAAAGISVISGCCEDACSQLIAPFKTTMEHQRPWVIAKWAMTLDGKIATRSGSSQWISNQQSREVVHRLRGRVDAIIVGSGTAIADDPLLTARPPGPRNALRVVVSSRAELPLDSKLVVTAKEVPVLVTAGLGTDPNKIDALQEKGIEVLNCPGDSRADILPLLMMELGKRGCTNVLVEGGAKLLGSLFDAELVDEVNIFVAPKTVGGESAPSPVTGKGLEWMNQAHQWDTTSESIGNDVLIKGRRRR